MGTSQITSNTADHACESRATENAKTAVSSIKQSSVPTTTLAAGQYHNMSQPQPLMQPSRTEVNINRSKRHHKLQKQKMNHRRKRDLKSAKADEVQLSETVSMKPNTTETVVSNHADTKTEDMLSIPTQAPMYGGYGLGFGGMMNPYSMGMGGGFGPLGHSPLVMRFNSYILGFQSLVFSLGQAVLSLKRRAEIWRGASCRWFILPFARTSCWGH